MDLGVFYFHENVRLTPLLSMAASSQIVTETVKGDCHDDCQPDDDEAVFLRKPQDDDAVFDQRNDQRAQQARRAPCPARR